LFNLKILRSTYFSEVKVISIGNLAVGGTGKTPTVEFIVNKLKDKYKLAVLSRGYLRKSKGFLIVDKTLKVEDVGDEAFQIATKFENITVAVCKKRTEGIKLLIEKTKPDIILLDDAFQHRKVIPTKSVILTEYYKPYNKDYFLPYGRLRDNKIEAHRAEIIIVTKSPENIFPIENTIWRENLKLFPYQKLFFTSLIYNTLHNFTDKNDTLDYEKLRNFAVILVTGIGRSRYLYQFIKDKAFSLKHINFPDHYYFKKSDVKKIEKEFNELKAQKKIIITTEKDYVKLKDKLTDEQKQHWYVQEIEFKFHFNKEEEFIQLIIDN